MPQFLYRLEPSRPRMLTDGPTPREAATVGEHFDYLLRLTESGTVLMAGRTTTGDERTFGLVVFEAESDAAAARIMADDPAVRAGVMRAELFPYRVATWSARGPGNG